MKSTRISRRAALRAGAAFLALPSLEMMLAGEGAHAATPPVYVFLWAFPNGTRMKVWRVSGGDMPLTAGNLSPALQPLSSVADDLTVVTGLNHKQTVAAGAHDMCFLGNGTMGPPGATGTNNVPKGPSIDQVLATKFGGSTQFRSFGICNDKPDLINTSVLSFDESGRAIQPYRDAKTVFAKLFTGGAVTPEITVELQRRRSLLDFFAKDAARLSKALGAEDRRTIDEHLTAVREVEKELNGGANPSGVCTAPDAPVDGMEALAMGRLYMRMLATAARCDLTRYMTFQLANEIGGRRYPGASRGDHDASHNGTDDEVLTITRAKMEEFRYFVQLLKDSRLPTGSLLDRSIVLCSSAIGNGNSHDTKEMPVIIAGRGGGLKSGRHLQRPGANYNDMLCSLLNYAGLPTTSFGQDGGGPLASL